MPKKILKKDFISVPHPKFGLYNFTSLGRATGYSATGIANLYARGGVNVIAASILNWDNCLAVEHTEVERIRRIKQGVASDEMEVVTKPKLTKYAEKLISR